MAVEKGLARLLAVFHVFVWGVGLRPQENRRNGDAVVGCRPGGNSRHALVYGAPSAELLAELVWSFIYLVLVLSGGATLPWFWLLAQGTASRVLALYA